ncbi:probable Found in Mitochondrial Proteome [Rhynchosporium secalis]|uniref:Probable Found in Mitochondrial Proteome n=1 Tax=Rhynchosporium secalis TaxID=38038 RepID=A0A1E1MPM0_RHYSE|nr:probable Found in Mitochondrial Proteome [Rhynchosporium secalis]
MDQRKEEVTRRPLYVYDLPQDILSTLTRKNDTGEDPQHNTSSSATDSAAGTRTETAAGAKSCSLCGVVFHTVEDQRSHNRSDLHNYNLKQKIRGAKAVTEGDFEKLIGDLEESLSGSDSDSEDEEDGDTRKETTLSALLKKQAHISSNSNDGQETLTTKRKRGSGKPPIIWFESATLPRNTYLGVYRAIFTNSEQENEPTILDIVRKKQLAPKPATKIPMNPSTGVPLPEAYKEPHIFLCMIGGGHFAAMIVSLTPKQTRSTPTGPISKEATVLAHKTFHRYTTRRKQGGAQSANDNAKGAAHSAGADLRRYNEQALVEEVRALLQDWKGMIETSELLFFRATGSTNRRTLFGPYDGQVLRQNDPRIRGFPFSTRRATQNELMRAFVELTRVKVLEVDEAAIAAARAEDAAKLESAKSAAAKKSATPSAPKLSEEEETALLHTSQLQALLRRSKVPALISYLKTNSLSPNFLFSPPDHHAPTPLHLSASQNSAPLITGLMLKAGADPSVLNGDGKTPFELCGDRSSRDAFRVARSELGEDKWNWEASHVPAAMTRAKADERDIVAKKEEAKQEEARREAETKRLEEEGPKVVDKGPLGKAAGRGRMKALGQVAKTAQEKREEEARGMTPEMRMRLDRERRARAAEERIKKMAGGSA